MTSLRRLHEALPAEKQRELVAKTNGQIETKMADRAFNEYPQNALLDEKSFERLYGQLEKIFVENDLKEIFSKNKGQSVSTGTYEFDLKTKAEFSTWYEKLHENAIAMLLDGRGNIKAELIQKYGWQNNPKVFSLRFIRDLIGAFVEAVFECFSHRLYGSEKEQAELFQKSVLKLQINSKWYFSNNYACALGLVFGEQNRSQKKYDNNSSYRIYLEEKLIMQNELLVKLPAKRHDPIETDAAIKDYILAGILHEFDFVVADAKEGERAKLIAIVQKARGSAMWLSVLSDEHALLQNAEDIPNVKMILQKFILMADYYRKQNDLTTQLVKLSVEETQELASPVARPLSCQSTSSESSSDEVFSPYSKGVSDSPFSPASANSNASLQSPVAMKKPAYQDPPDKRMTVKRAASQLMTWIRKRQDSRTPNVTNFTCRKK